MNDSEIPEAAPEEDVGGVVVTHIGEAAPLPSLTAEVAPPSGEDDPAVVEAQAGLAALGADIPQGIRVYNILTATANAMTGMKIGEANQKLSELNAEPDNQFTADAKRLGSAMLSAITAVGRMLSGADASETAQLLANASTLLEYDFADKVMSQMANVFKPIADLFSVTMTALGEIQRGNLAQGMKLLDAVTERLKQDDAVGRDASRFLPNILFASASAVRGTQGLPAARVLLNRAASTSEMTATAYAEDGSSEQRYLKGQARYYRSTLRWWEVQSLLAGWDLAAIQDEPALTEDIKAAIDDFTFVEQNSTVLKAAATMNLTAARMNSELLAGAASFAAHAKAILTSNVKAKDTAGLDQLRRRLETAREMAAGPYEGWRVFFDDLIAKVSNLSGLYRPKTRDFGVFAGLISCVAFIAVLATIGLANRLFSLKLEGTSLVAYAAVLALVAGFGYGAIRFKGLLFGGKEESSERERHQGSE